MSRGARQERLKERWFFDCVCPRCQDPTDGGRTFFENKSLYSLLWKNVRCFSKTMWRIMSQDGMAISFICRGHPCVHILFLAIWLSDSASKTQIIGHSSTNILKNLQEHLQVALFAIPVHRESFFHRKEQRGEIINAGTSPKKYVKTFKMQAALNCWLFYANPRQNYWLGVVFEESNYTKKIMAQTHKLLHIKLLDTGTQHLRGRNVFKRGSFYCGHVAAHGPGIAGGHNVF